MSFYSRPSHLRVPVPGEKKSEDNSQSHSEVAPQPITENDSASVPLAAEATTSKPVIEDDSALETGSALEAWSSSHSTAIAPGTPRVREQSVAKSQAQSLSSAKKTASLAKTAPPQGIAQTSSSPAQDEAQTDQQRNRESHRETRILVIENDVEAADHVINILESDGYAVEIATDATYGVMLAQTYLPHLILLGALSEHLSGADFMRSLRNVPGFAERAQVTPVLYLIDNSHLLQQRFQGLRDTPLTSTISKPANEHELLQKIERALNPETDFPTEIL